VNKRTIRPLAPTLIALGLAAGLALGGCHRKKANELIPQNEPTAPSSEWVAQNPTEPAVPVTLPKTPMTNAPPSSPAPSPASK